jgi:cell division protein FtsB
VHPVQANGRKARMAASKKTLFMSEREKSSYTQYKGITGTQISLECNQLHAKETAEHAELEDLKCDMAELNQILNTVEMQEVKGGYINRNKYSFIQDGKFE